MAMLERVEVDVIEVALIVGIANQMLPVTPLPNAALTSGRKGGRSAFDAGRRREKQVIACQR
jgi:hypothetical protein